MSHRIITKTQLADKVFSATIEAPLIAQARQPGQFVIVGITNEYSERIPLTIAGTDPEKGTIQLIWQALGKSTCEMAALQAGDCIENIVGPLGQPTHIKNFGTVVCIGGGIGNAPLLPIATALKEAGNTVISILGSRTKDLLILEDKFAQISDELIVTTDDGSHGRQGLVTEPLREVCTRDPKPDQAYVIGPAIMMKFCCNLTKELAVPIEASLNTIMVDGTGMCGGCRVEVGGQTKFVCVDGPEFDGHLVDFDMMMKRQSAYKSQEQDAMNAYRDHQCRVGLTD
jgi:ferredoxin--NADP+ reductase